MIAVRFALAELSALSKAYRHYDQQLKRSLTESHSFVDDWAQKGRVPQVGERGSSLVDFHSSILAHRTALAAKDAACRGLPTTDELRKARNDLVDYLQRV